MFRVLRNVSQKNFYFTLMSELYFPFYISVPVMLSFSIPRILYPIVLGLHPFENEYLEYFWNVV